jgi:hypothetical protein
VRGKEPSSVNCQLICALTILNGNDKQMIMKKQNLVGAAILAGVMLLNGCQDPVTSSTKPPVPLTIEQQIRDYAENVCAVEHVDRHSAQSLAYLESKKNDGFMILEFGIASSPAYVTAQCYVGSDLHAFFCGVYHAACIADYCKSLGTGFSIEYGFIYHNSADNNKVSKIDLPDITIRDGTYNPSYNWDYFFGARPSSGYDKTVFAISR